MSIADALEEAVAAFNAQPAGTVGLIVLAGFGVADIDLTGAGAITMPARHQPASVDRRRRDARRGRRGGWSPVRARPTLRGNIDMVGLKDPDDKTDSAPEGQVFLSGVLLAGGIRASGRRIEPRLAGLHPRAGRMADA